MRILGIYKILNKITGKFYIGKSANSIKHRWNVHKYLLRNNKHKNPHLQASWNLHGEDAFKFIILEVCTKENITEREQFWLNFTQCYDKHIGYNVNPNSENSLGRKFDQKTKNKISLANKGNKWSEEAKARIKGRKQSKSTIIKIIETKRKNGTLSTPILINSLKGNNRRRDIDKWPHELGVKCKCHECKLKRLNLYHRPRYKKIMGAEF